MPCGSCPDHEPLTTFPLVPGRFQRRLGDASPKQLGPPELADPRQRHKSGRIASPISTPDRFRLLPSKHRSTGRIAGRWPTGPATPSVIPARCRDAGTTPAPPDTRQDRGVARADVWPGPKPRPVPRVPQRVGSGDGQERHHHPALDAVGDPLAVASLQAVDSPAHSPALTRVSIRATLRWRSTSPPICWPSNPTARVAARACGNSKPT